MYFLAKYVDGAYETTVGFPSKELAHKAIEAMGIAFGHTWVLVHFPKAQHAVAA